MIRYKEYVIDADSNCYLVGKLKVEENKKTGETKEYISHPKHCSSLSQAVSILSEMIRRECVANNDMQLKELVSKLEEIYEEIRTALDFK